MNTKRIIGLSALFLLLCIAPLFSQSTPAPRSGDEAKLRFAATQHEIISILIEENQFSAVPLEFEKILDLNLRAGDAGRRLRAGVRS